MKKLIFCLYLATVSAANAQFDEESKSVPRPNLSVSSGEYEALGKAVKSGSEDLVVDRASKILAKDPDDVKALNAFAVHYIRTKKYGMAKILLNRALEKHPDESALHNNLAVIYLEEDEMPLALQSFRKSLKGGIYKIGAINLSSILLKHRDYRRALLPLEEAYAQARSDLSRGQTSDLANNYAVALMGTGEPKKAKEIFERLIAAGSRDPEVYLNQAILYVDLLGDKKNGQKSLSKLQFMTEDASILRQARELENRAR
jgi:Flp pilus assembly protein TadD